MNKIVIDSETTDLPKFPKKFGTYFPPEEIDNYDKCRIVELGWIVLDQENNILEKKNYLIKDTNPEKYEGFSIHNITDEETCTGESIQSVLEYLIRDLNVCKEIIGHNISFDIHVIMSEMYRLGMDLDILKNMTQYCTMKNGIEIVGITNKYGLKLPKLEELCKKLSVPPLTQHRAISDAQRTFECYLKMRK